jgi:serine/threonine-protein kinase
MADPHASAIGKYRIIELVGEGAMGVVYKAQDSVLDRIVAIKVMNDSIARQEDLRKRFLHEAQAAGSLSHPNVVCIYDLGEVEGHLFIAMEFVHGVDLERLIELAEPLTLQARLDIIIDVLTGLAFAHKRGIIHRDIKPANIRIGEDGRAKIMDFGVAHLASSSMTSTGSILGTPTYMAPEQITEGKTSPATDIFAVGGVLYQILTLMKPFDGPTLQNLFFKIITENPRPITDLMPGLPPGLDRIVQKALAKEPADRYATALDMANDLTAVRSKLSGPSYPASVSLSASVAGAVEMSRKSSQRRTRRLAFAGGGAIAAAALFAIAWRQFPHPSSASVAANENRPSVVVQASPQVAAAETPLTAPNTSAQKVQSPPPPAQAPVTQEKTSDNGRDARTRAAAKPAPQQVPSRTSAQTQSRIVVTPPPVTQGQATNPITRQDPVSSPPVVIARPVAAPPAQETTAPVAAPQPASAPTAGDIGPAVEAFARAIESRDVGTMRRDYPGLTAGQQRNFEDFFQSLRSLNVTFRVANVEGSGALADARLDGSYAFVTTTGITEHKPVSFAVTLRREGNGWRLVAMR